VGRRLILDTNLLIAYERGTIDRAALDDDELAVAAVTIAEYRVGIELADTAECRRPLPCIRCVTSVVEVIDYTDTTAAHHARLIAHARRADTPRGAHDLIIAAHAAETGRTLLSRDAKARFADLPSLIAAEA
jgi:tRNA(fMet)-specific endonuclease VapC